MVCMFVCLEYAPEQLNEYKKSYTWIEAKFTEAINEAMNN